MAALRAQDFCSRRILRCDLEKARAAEEAEQLAPSTVREEPAKGRDFAAIDYQPCSRANLLPGEMIASKIRYAVTKSINMNDGRLDRSAVYCPG